MYSDRVGPAGADRAGKSRHATTWLVLEVIACDGGTESRY